MKQTQEMETLAASAFICAIRYSGFTVLPTIHGELYMALSREGVVRDGDLHFVCALVRQPQVVQQERAVPEDEDAIAVLWPQVPDYVRSDGLHHRDGLLSRPLHLPLDHGLVDAAAGVADRQKGLSAHRAPHQLGLAGHVHSWNLTCKKTKQKTIKCQRSQGHHMLDNAARFTGLTPNLNTNDGLAAKLAEIYILLCLVEKINK